jgi:hypothetical protein
VGTFLTVLSGLAFLFVCMMLPLVGKAGCGHRARAPEYDGLHHRAGVTLAAWPSPAILVQDGRAAGWIKVRAPISPSSWPACPSCSWLALALGLLKHLSGRPARARRALFVCIHCAPVLISWAVLCGTTSPEEMSMKLAIRSMAATLAAGFLMTAGAQAEEERNLFDDAPWYVGAGVGYTTSRAMSRWTPAPSSAPDWAMTSTSFLGGTGSGPRAQPADGEFKDPNRDLLDGDIWGVGASLDGLLHLRNAKNLHWDPYLSAGVAVKYYEEDLEGSNPEAHAAGGRRSVLSLQ